MFNTDQRNAWQPPHDTVLSAQDLLEFPKTKSALLWLDAAQRVRVRLARRLDAVADFGGCELETMSSDVLCAVSSSSRVDWPMQVLTVRNGVWSFV
jgi:hypothetical protein